MSLTSCKTKPHLQGTMLPRKLFGKPAETRRYIYQVTKAAPITERNIIMNHLIKLADIIAANPEFVAHFNNGTHYRFDAWTPILSYTSQTTGGKYLVEVRGTITYHPKTLLAGTVTPTLSGAVIYSAVEGEQETARAFYGGATVAGYDVQVIKNIADRFFVAREDYAETLWQKFTLGA